MSKSERGNFKGGETITVVELSKQQDVFGYVAASEIRIDNANVILLPNSAAVYRMPPAKPYMEVEREDAELYGTLHGLSAEGLKMPQRIASEESTKLMIDVGDGYYAVWDDNLAAALKRRR